MGCGTNPKSCHFWNPDYVILSDTEKNELKYVHKKYPTCDVIRCSIDSLPFVETIFDNVLSYHVLEHVKKPELAVFEISRILQNDGKFYVAVPYGRSFSERFNSFFAKIGGAKYDHVWKYSLTDITALLQHFNFNIIKKRQLTFFRPLIAGLTLHFSILFSTSDDKYNYVYRVKAFSSKDSPFFSAALSVIERIDSLITQILPSICAEIEVKAEKQV